MRNFLFALLLFLASTAFVVEAAGGGGCASEQLKCPNSMECPDSGFSYVKDCLDCEGNYNTFNAGKQCFDRKLFNATDNPSPNYLWRDIVGMIVWFCAAGIATACGVGGGGIYVPLGIILMNFAPKPSSGLSQCSIFGASLGGLVLNLRNRHPYSAKIEQTGLLGAEAERATADIPTNEDGEPETAQAKHYTRPLIDYDMALFLAPMEMAGAVLGVVIQTVLPNWLYLFVAAIILGFTARKTYLKWWSTRAKEMAKAAALEADADSQEEVALTAADANESSDPETPDPEKAPSSEGVEVKAEDVPDMVDETTTDGIVDSSDDEVVVMDAEKMKKRLHFLERDSRQYPKEKLICFAILWAGLTLLTFLKGGKGVPSLVGINCESPWFGFLVGCQFLWTFGFAAYFAIKLMREATEKKACGYPFHEQDVLWDFSKTRFYAFFTFVAGIVAGLIGIGGGMVLGPLMLVMGIYPRVSTATTATMIVLTSSGVAISYVTAGLVPWEYAITFFCTCFIGALVGKTKIDAYVKKTGKSSILIFLLATIIALATFMALLIALLRLHAADWCFPGFKPFCYVDDGTADAICVPSEEERMLGSNFYGDVVRGGL
eukprot:CAMPEP_0116156454 /NCGR_PEP_ID=MMETSP0329-20121206/22842_1 /TAXON_ID=697910 /ORGANISM="Pseudo-nitzschia arenysensis, Strain B593" /LENGTH=603 /DNA_ID=CAMNT_0003653541 /DNA_START=235 /DNA_END=2046 /DNA_ORIENTATION=-